MSRTFEFTDRRLKSLPLPRKPQQLDYFDTKARGLGLRISYGGRRTFFAMYVNGAGKRQRVSLGEIGRLEDGKLSLAEARKRTRALLGDVARSRDPAAEARQARHAPTVEQLARDFIADRRRRGIQSADWQARVLERDILPDLGRIKARDLTRADIKAVMKKITERPAPVLANRALEIVRAMLGYAVEEELLQGNVADRLGKGRNPEPPRERWLSLEEIAAYWKALDEENSGPAAALKLCALTAQRLGNVLGMRRDQLSLHDRLWIIPASRTKTRKSYKVPISEWAMQIIEDRIAELEAAEMRRAKRERREPQPVTWIFPRKYRGDGPADRTFIAIPHRNVCRRADIHGFTIHDWRRCFGSHCDHMGVSRLIWDSILGHVAGGMADIYSGADFLPQRRECMEKWSLRIAKALADNVVDLPAQYVS